MFISSYFPLGVNFIAPLLLYQTSPGICNPFFRFAFTVSPLALARGDSCRLTKDQYSRKHFVQFFEIVF
jgi:hypothetical protein